MTKTIEVSDETYEKIKDQLNVDEQQDIGSIEEMVGSAFFFRTVTFHIIGKVEGYFGRILRLSNASWVADSGRFMDAILTGKLNEVEPLGQWYVNLDTVTDFGPWTHDLPKDQK